VGTRFATHGAANATRRREMRELREMQSKIDDIDSDELGSRLGFGQSEAARNVRKRREEEEELLVATQGLVRPSSDVMQIHDRRIMQQMEMAPSIATTDRAAR